MEVHGHTLCSELLKLYNGSFDNDGLVHGTGTLNWGNRVLHGEFNHGKLHGRASISSVTKKGQISAQVVFEHGVLVSPKIVDGKVENFIWSDGCIYNGQVDEFGFKHGTGGTVFPNGDRYDGEYNHDKICGRGIYACSDGSNVYKGEFKDSKRNGHGKMTYADGSTYSGGWKDDDRNGHGVRLYPRSYIFEGGKKLAKTGKVSYNGAFRDDEIHGKGVLMFSDGSSYNGEFQNGKQNGYGVLLWPVGSDYYQQFVKLNVGKPIDSSISYSYCGGMLDNLMHGFGTKNYPDRSMYKGEWRNDQRHGKGKMTRPDRSFYDGDWQYGLKHGKGKTNFPDGSWHEGGYLNDKMHGPGTFLFSNGDKYDGQWQNDEKHGHGIMNYSDGSTYDGEWFNDEPVDPEARKRKSNS